MMKNILTFEHKHEKELPEEFRSDDTRHPESLVRYFLKEFSKEGDKILDPFAGFGTTLIVAEEMKRIPFGVEFDEKRADYIRSQIQDKNNLINGDSLKINTYDLPMFDLCFTSPPYANIGDKVNAFTACTTEGTYEQYLQDYHKIYLQIKQIMRKGSHIILEVSNLKRDGEITPLAWDIAREVSKVFHFEGEIVIIWEGTHDGYGGGGTYGYGYDNSYCLIFRNK